jgi:hypothetical protein
MLNWLMANWHPGWVDLAISATSCLLWYRSGKRHGYRRGWEHCRLNYSPLRLNADLPIKPEVS